MKWILSSNPARKSGAPRKQLNLHEKFFWEKIKFSLRKTNYNTNISFSDILATQSRTS